MGFTNKTAHFELPQWTGEDKPTFLVDMNNAYQKIDEEIYSAKANSEGAVNTANNAIQNVATISQELVQNTEELGRLGGEVALIRGSLTSVDSRVQALEGTEGTVTQQLSSLNNSVAGINNTITGINVDITQIEGDIAVLKNKTHAYTGVLNAGETSVTIVCQALTENSFIDVYTDVYGVSPVNVTAYDDTKRVVLDFAVRQEALNITVKVGV